MTAIEMQYNFQSKLQGLMISPPFFDSFRIETLLNEAQDLYIERYAPLIDTSEDVRKRLNVLIRHSSLSLSESSSSNLPNGYFVSLPGNVRRVLMEYITASEVEGIIRVKPIKYDIYLMEKDNPFKKPDSNLVWRIDYGEGFKHEIITDGTVIPTYYKIRYIAHPQPISILEEVDCILPQKDHNEIIDIALSLVNIPKET